MQQRPEGTRMIAQAYHWILKLARMIADLAGSDSIETTDPSLRSGQARRRRFNDG
jgi:predicted ATPase with chaperone activity